MGRARGKARQLMISRHATCSFSRAWMFANPAARLRTSVRRGRPELAVARAGVIRRSGRDDGTVGRWLDGAVGRWLDGAVAMNERFCPICLLASAFLAMIASAPDA